MSEGVKSKLKLMVVDDEPDNLDLLYRTFRREFRVFKADGALNALETLDREGEMAVIISDQRMPEMNGTEFLGKTLERFPDTIRILLTGYTDVEDLVEAINSGKVFKYITKPWNTNELKQVVQQAAETYQVLKQRTNKLERALRRESLFNDVTTAIRESLDYRSMLQTIVETIGQTFEANCCILRPVEGGRLMPDSFSYEESQASSLESRGGSEEEPPSPDNSGANFAPAIESDPLVQAVLESHQSQLTQNREHDLYTIQLAVPLICQQDLLAVLSLYKSSDRPPWLSEDIQLIEGVAEQAALAVSQAKLYQRIQNQAQQMRAELEVARQIQSNLLRQSWPELEGVKVQACCYPAREVGGDFFEVFIHSQGDVWLAVGDVSGKGVPAALFMASAISVMRRELSQETSPEPNVLMKNLNSILSDDLVSNNCFITMALARYTPATGQLAYANAGHVYPLVWPYRAVLEQTATDIEPNYLKVRGVPLGILPEWKAESGRLELNSGEALLLTSDGITEATVTPELISNQTTESSNSSTGLMLRESGLWQLLLQQRGTLDLSSLLDRIRGQNELQEDDQTILALEVL